MNKPHIIAAINGAILIGIGLFSYFSNPERPFTALIGPIVGIILLLAIPAIKKSNKTIAHIIAVLTLIFGLMSGYLGLKSLNIEDAEKRDRRILVFSVMSASSLLATGYYVARFILIKKGKI